MKVTVNVVGGLFDEQRVTTVDDERLTVMGADGVSTERPLDPDATGPIWDLARRVATLDVVSDGQPAVDGGSTTIEITTDDEVTCAVVVAPGDDPDPIVWDLLDAVEALADPDPPAELTVR